ncbi:CPBP family intramembrane glutamic endopeptidase [Aquimarina hainanensis]|uniref:CPBP family intramembrane glutamic endopeptidase n=2 Tax=Aquimarina hainanensis TaxID=1578017 RepID=A0ABW5N3F2_9FLAO
MNNTFLTTKLTPIVTIALCYILYLSGYFQMTIAAVLLLIASAIEYKKGLFKSLGFRWNKSSAKNLLLTAPLLGTLLFLFYYYVLVPVVTHFTGHPIDFSVFEVYTGNLPEILKILVYVWISAAFAEEIVFRGYLMSQFTKFFGSSNISLVCNILLFGLIFGWVHAYQGISGQIVAGITGMLLAVIFHIRKNDLWFNIAIHGFLDTVFLIFVYNGWL